MKISNKLLFGFIGIAFLTVVVGSISYTTNNTVIRSTNHLRENVIAERKAATAAKSALVAVRDGAQMLTMEKYRAALEPDEAVAAEKSAQIRLEEIDKQLENYLAQLAINRAIIEKAVETADNEQSRYGAKAKQQLAIVGEIEREFTVFSQRLRQHIFLINSDFRQADEFEREQLVPHYETRLLPLVNQYEANASQSVETTAENIEDALHGENTIIIFSTAIALLVAFPVGIYLAASISKPIRRLEQAALEIGGGNFGTRIVVKSRDEIGVLGNAFNEMAEQIEVRAEKLENFNNQLAAELGERKRAEAALRESEAEYTALAKATSEIVWCADKNGQDAETRSAWEKITGQKHESKGWDWLDFVHADDRETAQECWRRAFDTKTVYEDEFRVLVKSGEYRWFMMRGVPIVNDRNILQKWVGTMSDINERKRAVELLLESEASYRQLANAMPQIVWTARPDGFLDYYNQRWFDYTGMTLAEIEGWGWEAMIHPDDLPNCLAAWNRAVETGEKYQIEYRFKRGCDGTYRWHLGQALLTRDAENRRVKWFGTNTDIHEQKKVEAELRQVQETLETRVQIRTAALEQANSDLKEEIAERRRAVEKLQQSEEWMKAILDGSRDGIVIEDNAKVVYANNSYARLFGYEKPEDIFNQPTSKFLPPEEAERMMEYGRRRLRGEQPPSVYEFKGKCQDESLIEVEGSVSTSVIVGKTYIMTAVRDITERKRADDALRESENKFRMLIENTSEGLLQVDNDDRAQFVNDRFCEMVGYAADELMNENWTETLLDDDGRELIRQANERRRKGFSDRYEIKLRKKSGEFFWVNVGGAPMIGGDGKIVGSLGVFTDITERKSAEEQLLHDAFHDGLTGLSNRALFMDHLRMTIERCKSRHSNSYAVLFLDFDRFKVVNDSLGHAEGDKLLKQIARRLEAATRTGDLVARLGGDEFVVLLNELVEENEAVQVAERIQIYLKKPFDLTGSEIFISASIGIALSQAGHQCADDMVRDADIAMYRAKTKGRAQCQIFDRSMHDQAAKKLSLETEMRRALERDEFLLHYQPIINLKTKRLVGFEALARWQHPERGLIPPIEFIPAAEENKLILPLGRWILRESCRQMRDWQNGNPALEHLTISVNLSSKQFSQPDLTEQISRALNASGLDPHCLKLEITESHIMENTEVAIKTMNNLRALGVELSLDDFGTGYSSLSYLHRLPVSCLKIDRSFVSRMIESVENGEIVSTIIRLAQNLKMNVVAEGIETVEQLNYLKSLTCEYGQGYLFSKPLESSAALLFIGENLQGTIYQTDRTIINLERDM